MDAASILGQINPCDRDNPYIFISYNSADYQRVWEDALTLQQLGYNVWLDERNLDKTKPSWTDDALEAISDIDCALLLFYVSRFSLTSDPCYRELNQTVATQTMRIHFGPVPFVAVDVENVGNINDFAHSLHTELIHRKDIAKQERTSRAIILSKFCDDFFALDNERVRIHPKDEPNRKSHYYADLIAQLPEETRIYEPVVTLDQLHGNPVHPPAEDSSVQVEETAVQNDDAESETDKRSTAPEDETEEPANAGVPSEAAETGEEAEPTKPSQEELIASIAAQLKQRSEAETEAADDSAQQDSELSSDEPEEASTSPALTEKVQELLAKRTSTPTAEAEEKIPPAKKAPPNGKPLTLAEKLRQYMAEKE